MQTIYRQGSEITKFREHWRRQMPSRHVTMLASVPRSTGAVLCPSRTVSTAVNRSPYSHGYVLTPFLTPQSLPMSLEQEKESVNAGKRRSNDVARPNAVHPNTGANTQHTDGQISKAVAGSLLDFTLILSLLFGGCCA